MIGRLPELVRIPIVPAFGGNVELLADYGLYPSSPGTLVKVNDAEHRPMICNGQCGELQISSVACQIRYTARPVEEAVGGMDVKVDKIGVFHKGSYS